MLYKWQYNGRAPWDDIVKWCFETFGTSYWWPHHETICFTSEEDYALFLLRWA
jgi:hypothetical protein